MLQGINDKFDTDGAENLVIIGYPENEDHLPDLIFWSCFPNDPVCWITYPYIKILRDDVMASAMSKFIEFHLGKGQVKIVEEAFDIFIKDERENLIPTIIKLSESSLVKAWLT
ncbi:MAG: hypothetical protein GY787_10735 [Alteromonadales bacterium]|nr:hypothetical protein [Alteromonadales bacterium]